jgi:hypothetical protein
LGRSAAHATAGDHLPWALAARESDTFRPDPAGSLNNLGIRLAGAGPREDALAAVEEAVGL